ncbi:MAG: MBL fold metallo-hydrolase [archaeon GB-1867-005]|nr:MBL fold metallo-hydrolase [Candidatus Culexmicrobium cathedralense]
MQAHITIGEVDSLKIHAVISYGISSNIYIIENESGAVLIDAGFGPPHSNLVASLEKFNIKIEDISKVLITHRHKDHTNGLKQILNQVEPQIYVHRADADIVINRLKVSRSLVVKMGEKCTINVGEEVIDAIHTPGHTAGSTCYLLKNILFSGDLVFASGGFGRTDLPTGNLQELIRSLNRISRLNVNVLLPGHGELVLSDAKLHIKLALKNAKSLLKMRRKV